MGSMHSHHDKECARCGGNFKCKAHTNKKYCDGCQPHVERERGAARRAARRVAK